LSGNEDVEQAEQSFLEGDASFTELQNTIEQESAETQLRRAIRRYGRGEIGSGRLLTEKREFDNSGNNQQLSSTEQLAAAEELFNQGQIDIKTLGKVGREFASTGGASSSPRSSSNNNDAENRSLAETVGSVTRDQPDPTSSDDDNSSLAEEVGSVTRTREDPTSNDDNNNRSSRSASNPFGGNSNKNNSSTGAASSPRSNSSSNNNNDAENRSLAETVGSVTRDREDPTFNDESATVGRAIDDAVARANRNLSGRRGAAAENAEQELANKQGETRAAVSRIGQQQLNAQKQNQKQNETFGDIPIQNPLTGNRLEDDLGDVAGGFQKSAETVFANLGRVQPTPVTIGTGSTRTAEETTSGIRGAGLESFIGALNPAEIALDTKEIAEFAIKRGDEVGEIALKPTADLLAGNQIDTTTELQNDLNTEVSILEEQARQNPAQTTASVIGGIAGGIAGGFAAARGARGAIRGARSLDLDSSDIVDAVITAQQRSTGSMSSITGGDIDVVNDIFDRRLRFDGGREQKQIEKTEEIERERIDQDQLDELAQRQGLDDSISDIEQTARRRLPPQREFETEGEFRRELERAMRKEEKQRLKSQSESDSNTRNKTNTDTDTRTRTTERTAAAVGGIGGGFGQISVEIEPEIPNADINQPEFEPVIQPVDIEADAGFVVEAPSIQIGAIEEEITQEVGAQDQIAIPIEDIGERIGIQIETGTQDQIETGIQEQITTPEVEQGQEIEQQLEEQREQEIQLETQLELNQKKQKKDLEIPPLGELEEIERQPDQAFAGVRNVESTLTQRDLTIQ
jgi:hypothetical protein